MYYCCVHQSKKAKYHLINDNQEENAYCSKCAILLASQGLEIKEIQAGNEASLIQMNDSAQCNGSLSNDVSVSDEAEIKRGLIIKFMQEISESIPTWEDIQNNISYKKEEVLQYINKQSNKIEQLFLSVEKMCIEYKNKAFQQLNQKREAVIQMY